MTGGAIQWRTSVRVRSERTREPTLACCVLYQVLCASPFGITTTPPNGRCT